MAMMDMDFSETYLTILSRLPASKSAAHSVEHA